tara:strand:+ start:912 stop:1313 length:402 start_codon:yes stop_codon:yes gene_type:complete
MNKKYNIRYIETKDLDIIHDWWVRRDEKPVSRDLLPQNGLGGLIIENKDITIAACFIFLTNSKMGYIDHLISNPDYKGKGFWHYPLMKACFKAAKQSGCNEVWGTSSVRGVVKLLERYGCEMSEEPHYIIWPR